MVYILIIDLLFQCLPWGWFKIQYGYEFPYKELSACTPRYLILYIGIIFSNNWVTNWVLVSPIQRTWYRRKRYQKQVINNSRFSYGDQHTFWTGRLAPCQSVLNDKSFPSCKNRLSWLSFSVNAIFIRFDILVVTC